jgi:hypothetical protein
MFEFGVSSKQAIIEYWQVTTTTKMYSGTFKSANNLFLLAKLSGSIYNMAIRVILNSTVKHSEA